jgi:hypothetical protein
VDLPELHMSAEISPPLGGWGANKVCKNKCSLLRTFCRLGLEELKVDPIQLHIINFPEWT